MPARPAVLPNRPKPLDGLGIAFGPLARQNNGMDVLSDVLTAVQLTGAVFFDVEAYSPWVGVTPHIECFKSAVMPNAEHIIAFHIVLSGSCWAEVPDCFPPAQLQAGDLVVIPMGDEHVLSSAPGLRGQPNVGNYKRPANRRLPVPFVLNQGGRSRSNSFRVRILRLRAAAI